MEVLRALALAVALIAGSTNACLANNNECGPQDLCCYAEDGGYGCGKDPYGPGYLCGLPGPGPTCGLYNSGCDNDTGCCQGLVCLPDGRGPITCQAPGGGSPSEGGGIGSCYYQDCDHDTPCCGQYVCKDLGYPYYDSCVPPNEDLAESLAKIGGMRFPKI